MPRSGKPLAHGQETLDRLAAEIKDHNYRVFAEDEMVHVVSAGLHLADSDPFALFEQMLTREPKNLDASHAFYMGYEMAKAFARHGADVVITSRKIEACQAVAAEIEAMGRRALSYACHIGHWDELPGLVEEH